MTTTNNQHTKQNSKQYIISKNVSPDDMREIAENFEDPSKYLSIDPRIVVGILPFQSKHTVPNILPSRPVTSTQTVTQLRPKTTSNLPINKAKKLLSRPTSSVVKPQTSNPSPYYNNLSAQRPLSSSIHYEVDTKEQLNNIFKESKQRELHSKEKGTDDFLPKSAMEKVKEGYINQEKLLKKKDRERVKSARISKRLSSLSAKKESDLLLNRVEEYRLKRQMLEIIDNNKPIEEKYGNNYWMFSLRRPKYLDFIRINYVNVGTKDNEIWKPMLEYPYKCVETIQNPESIIKNKFSNLVDQKYYCEEVKRCKCRLPNMKGINEIKVEGKSLVEEEYKLFNDYCNMSKEEVKLRLFKDPFNQKNKNVQEITYKMQYDKPTLEICKCKYNTNKMNSVSSWKNKHNKKQ